MLMLLLPPRMLPRISHHTATNLRRSISSTSLSSSIHPTAIVHPSASIHPTAHVGPFSIIGKNVSIGDKCNLHSHVVIKGHTTIGSRCNIFHHAVIGTESQDKKYTGQPTHTSIGADCTVREFVTINRGTFGATSVGRNVHLLTSAHVGHDCTVGDDVVVSNGTCLAGHVSVGNGVILGGMCGVKQRVRIGSLAMIGGGSFVDNNVVPFGLVVGNRATLRGVNLIGLRRAKAPRREIQFLLSSQRYLYPSGAPEGSSFAPRLDLPFHVTLHDRVAELKREVERRQQRGGGGGDSKEEEVDENDDDDDTTLVVKMLDFDLFVDL